MKLSDLFKRQNEESDSYPGLESSLSEMILLESPPPIEPEASDLGPQEIAYPLPEPEPSGGERMSAYSQARLAELSTFEDLSSRVVRDLDTAASALSLLKAAHQQTRDFAASVHASIHRANEFEIANGRLTAENRHLYQQAEQVKRLKDQHESLVTAFRQREARMFEASESLRLELSAAKLRVAESESSIRSAEVDRQETLNALAAATSQNDLLIREVEMMREKQINLVTDHDAVSRKRLEAERRVDELAALHARDVAEIADLRSKLPVVESERQRLQRSCDAQKASIVELSDRVRDLERELDDTAKRHDVAISAIKAERETLLARLEVSGRGEAEQSARSDAPQLQLAHSPADKTASLEDSSETEA